MSSQQSQSLLGTRLHAACACSSARKFSPPGTERKYERSRPFQIRHLSLDLSLNEKEKSVSGSATLTVERRAPLGTELRLDAIGLQLKSLSLTPEKGKELTLSSLNDYSYDGDEIVISLPSGFESGNLTIHYRAVPKLGLYFLEPDRKVPNRPQQVWSQCQDEDGRHWFPCQDKPHVKMSYELRVELKNGMSVLSGGTLVSKKTPAKGRWSFHYHLDVPTPAYLITLVAGHFEEWSENTKLPSGKVIPLRYLVPKGKKADGKRAFQRTANAIQLFSERTGIDYPFERYTQVVVSDFIFGGMENTTATTMYEHILIDNKAAIDIDSHDLVAHELAHQWFGDLVTCRDWSHAWLNEGFATFFEHVEREDRLGLDEYEHNVTVDLNLYLSEARGDYQRAIVCRDYEEPIDLFDRHLYQKGGLVLHMLRRRLGDACFWQGVHSYLKAHQGGIVETNDLMRALEESSGTSLEKFFDQWVYRPGHPELRVKIRFDSGILTVDVEQNQKGTDVATFELPFEIEVEADGKTLRHQRRIDEKKSSLVVRLDKRPNSITIDPDYLIAAPIALSAPADMLRTLLSSGTRARARRMAAMALSKRQDPDTLAALACCLKNARETWFVRAKAAESLGKIRGDIAEATLIATSQNAHPKVRRAIATALGEFRTKRSTAALVKLTADESFLVTASAARALGKSRAEGSSKLLKALLRKNSWSEVVRAAALSALAAAGDETNLPLLMEWSRYGKPLRARRAAISALPRLSEGKGVREHLVDMLQDHDPHTRSAVLSALGELGDSKARNAILALSESELDGGVRTRARQVLSDLKGNGSSDLKEAKREQERLERKVSELGSRLSRLEQLLEEQSSSKSSKTKSTSTTRSKQRTAGKNRTTTQKKGAAKKTGRR